MHNRYKAILVAASRNSGIPVAIVRDENATVGQIPGTRGTDEAGVLRDQQVHALVLDRNRFVIVLPVECEAMVGTGLRAFFFKICWYFAIEESYRVLVAIDVDHLGEHE